MREGKISTVDLTAGTITVKDLRYHLSPTARVYTYDRSIKDPQALRADSRLQDRRVLRAGMRIGYTVVGEGGGKRGEVTEVWLLPPGSFPELERGVRSTEQSATQGHWPGTAYPAEPVSPEGEDMWGYNRWLTASLTALLMLGLFWPVPLGLAADSPPVVTQTLTYANGDAYTGETVNGQRQGEGVYTYKDGRRYTGSWQDNKRHGSGTLTFPNGDKYVGDFAEGVFNGQGTYTLSNGQQYTGSWKEDKQNGQGTLTYPNGDTYIGAWKDGKRDGQGTYTVHDGQQYIGAWQENKRHGKGTWVFADGKKYVGEWRDDEQVGRGTMTPP